MVKVRVKLYGTLSHDVPGYDPETGLVLEVVDGARVEDLLAQLEIPEAKGAVVAVEGKVVHPKDPLKDGTVVHLMQAMDGG